MTGVAVLGCGYAGLGTGLALALCGHQVSFVDPDTTRIGLLRKGETPLREPGLREALQATRAATAFGLPGELNAADAEAVFLAVGTPPGPGGAPDLTALRRAIEDLLPRPLGGAETLIVIKSTVPVGTARQTAHRLASAGLHRTVVANPEFLREGSMLEDALYPRRIVIGADEAGPADRLEGLYRRIIDRDFPLPPGLPRPSEGRGPVRVIRTSPETAELGKYAANAFLAARVSLVNEVADLCDALGGDILGVEAIVGSDERIGPSYLRAGPGFGGSCLPKDLLALTAAATSYGLSTPLLRALTEANVAHQERLVDTLIRMLPGPLETSTVTVLGLAFKVGTDDVRGSQGIALAGALAARGAGVRVHDPVALVEADARDLTVDVAGSIPEALRGSDAAVVMTEWPEYISLDWAAQRALMRRPAVFDTRNVLDPRRMADAGFLYKGLGRTGCSSAISAGRVPSVRS